MTKPLLIQNLNQKDQASAGLEPVSLEKPPYNEDWLQNLIHAHPELVPAGEVEACFDNLVPVLREFPVPSGYLDNFYITPEGYPVLVEVKLWKNQEARRKVVAQILEYAKDFAALSYEDINKEIRKQIKDHAWGSNPLHEIVAEYVAGSPEEQTFVDRVSRNLREGRFLLLILGDGIREEMAALAGYLMHHSLRYAFGMVEIKLFTLPDGSILALPQVLAKTQTIERHVTVVTAQGGKISVAAPAPVISETVEKTSLSTDEFYELMAQNDPHNVTWLKDFINKLSDLPIDVQAGNRGESLMIKAPVPDGGQIHLMYVTPTTAQFWGVPNKQWKDPKWQHLARTYLDRIAALVPGATIKTFASSADIKVDGKPLPISSLHGKAEEVVKAMCDVTQEAENYFSSEEAA
ncbi:MAG: hypothetical protein DHS20C02_10920 [Micavibrio sp.]|nr:MAG: hypothetical protein DHS20C02_10920 [Micavibrio sp.]